MGTGACGICCDVCRLNLLGICSTCGAGTSHDGKKKLTAQIRIMQFPCPVLECAVSKEIAFCPRDCASFPCERFYAGYPFSESFLAMQKRRRAEKDKIKAPSGKFVTVPGELWDDVAKKPAGDLCASALAEKESEAVFRLSCLNALLRIDIRCRMVTVLKESVLVIKDPLLELLVLVYLRDVKKDPVERRWIGVKDLYDRQFFTGPHKIETEALCNRFGHDPGAFFRAASKINGTKSDLDKNSVLLRPFPKIPIIYILREGDETFRPSVRVLFDRSIQKHLKADAIWGIVNWTSTALLKASCGMEIF